jgi:hypothetical protein
MAVLCPAKCGKKFTTQAFAEAHADEAHPDWRIPKSKGWRTPYGFGDWSYPVTYEFACAEMKKFSESIAHKFNQPRETTK